MSTATEMTGVGQRKMSNANTTNRSLVSIPARIRRTASDEQEL